MPLGHPAKQPGKWKRLLISAVIALGTAVAVPTVAVGADDDESTLDGRLEGYGPGQDVALTKSSTGSTWIVFLLLAATGCLVLFKNPKRAAD